MTTDITETIEAASQVAARADEESIALLASAEQFTITSDIQYGASAELLQTIKAQQKQMESLRKSVTRPLDEAKTRVLGLFKPATDRLSKAELTIKNAMLTFSRDRERQRQEAQEKLRQREEAERERLRKQAEAAREKGKETRAETLEQRAENVPTLEVTAPAPAAPGITTRVTWRAEVTDLAALVKAVADGSQATALLAPNMTLLNNLARAMKGDLDIPGVQAVSEEGIAARA